MPANAGATASFIFGKTAMSTATSPTAESTTPTRPRKAPRCGLRASLQMAIAGFVMTVAASGAYRLRHDLAEPPAMGGPLLPATGLGPGFDDATQEVLHDDALELISAMQHLHHLQAQEPGDDELTRLPVQPVHITSRFGRRSDPFGHGEAFHSGIDFAAPAGTAVRAAGDGLVIAASFRKDYGNVVMVDHGDGCVTLYAHNRKLLVRVGDPVLAGQEIAEVGSTGRSTGPHLHFEVRQSGERVDPKRYLAGL